MDTQLFVRDRFAEFYHENSVNIEAPNSIEKREFGFLLFEEKIMVRHKGFATVENLRSFIEKTVPSHVYYSTAYYEMPEEKMEDKGWLGANLYFDIDADHIPTKCGKIHDIWSCKDCGCAGRGITPEKCPKCGNKRFDERTWSCGVCLESAKLETMKLVDILTGDFGFSSEDVNVSFSGNRGYHVHVDRKEISDLDSIARKEIVDYIMGIGLEPAFVGLISGKSGIMTEPPKLGDAGWRGRIARGTYEFFQEATEEDLKKMGLKKKAIDDIIEKKDLLPETWKKSGPWNLIKGLGMKGWNAIVQRSAVNQAAQHDTVVTTDIHRLIRLTNTLHGKTGLLKVSFPTEDLEQFDPLKSAVAFKKDEATIYVEEAPRFRLGEETFGSFKKQRVELPMAAALFLLCKNAAKVTD